MKKLWILLLTFAMLFALVACGEKEPADDAPKTEEVAQEPGATYDVGAFEVYVPGGWKELPVVDVFSEDGAIDPTVIQICKGGDSEADIYTHPYIRLTYFDPDTTMGKDKSFYDDVEDLDPVVAGEHTWEAFNCTSLGYKMTILWLTEDGHDFQAVLYTDSDNGTIGATDADVLEILASVAPKQA